MQDKPKNPREEYSIAYDPEHVDYTLIISRMGREAISKHIEPSRCDRPLQQYFEKEGEDQ